jgi:thymidylate synthase
MKVIRAPHVDDALILGLQHLADAGVLEDSARGPVIVAATPVTTVFIHPLNNASLCPIRDANPFFHLIEALWMLSGQSDARMLDPYIKGFSARVAEDDSDGYDHGAYGWRWRSTFGFDQIERIVQMLKDDPTTRQAVLQMWDCGMDSHDLTGNWKDRPCNTHVYFRVLAGEYLDMTVCNRSNDIIWGAYGANAVHFSFLLQYMASRLGLKANAYYQISNNYHAYTSEIDNLCRRASVSAKSVEQKLVMLVDAMQKRRTALTCDSSQGRGITLHAASHAVPDLNLNLAELQALFDTVKLINNVNSEDYDNVHPIVAAAQAHKEYRDGFYDIALHCANQISWPNWREACTGWLSRRIAVRQAVPALLAGE